MVERGEQGHISGGRGIEASRWKPGFRLTAREGHGPCALTHGLILCFPSCGKWEVGGAGRMGWSEARWLPAQDSSG